MNRMVDEDEAGGGGSHDFPVDAARLRPRKAADAFRTISEVADELHVPQHVLRFWETKFPQVRPLKRGGGRRYYRPEDVALLRRVADLLYTHGYTIKGVQRLLREGGGELREHIPPMTPQEREAALAEREAGLVGEVGPRKPAPTQQLPMPGILPPEGSGPARGAAARPRKADAETERLRLLLGETLHALEEMRRLIG